MKHFGDQADGLRRLLRKVPPQVVSVVTFGASSVRWLASEARTGADAGSRTVIFDEVSVGNANLADALGVAARFDLLQAVERHVSLDAVKVNVGEGLMLYPAARMARALVGADRLLGGRFGDSCRTLQRGADLWLVHARLGEGFELSPLAAAAHRLVVVIDGNAQAVTDAYSFIKRLAGGPWPQVDLALGGRASADAEALVRNLAATVPTHVGLGVRRINGLEASAEAAAALSDTQEREGFLERVLGFARRAPRSLALGV